MNYEKVSDRKKYLNMIKELCKEKLMNNHEFSSTKCHLHYYYMQIQKKTTQN